jgi:hypothetical protein
VAVLRHCVYLLAIIAVSLTPQPARAAECHYETSTIFVNGTAQTQTVQVCTDSPDGDSVTPVDLPPSSLGWDPLCVTTAIENGVDPMTFCDIPPEEATTVLTPALVASAMKTIPLPPSVLEVEPPNGRTLVNFDTNFFTTTQPFDTTLALLGQRVDLHITPAQFTWQFGDGESSSTNEPGAPYPALDVTHAYLTKGHVAPSVDTTYTAQFRVNGGPWRDVPGTVTIAGAPVDLQVLTATPVLVGYN